MPKRKGSNIRQKKIKEIRESLRHPDPEKRETTLKRLQKEGYSFAKIIEIFSGIDFTGISLAHYRDKGMSSDLQQTIIKAIKRKGTEKRTHRGMPVYFADIFGQNSLAFYLHGRTIINKDCLNTFHPDCKKEFYEKEYWQEIAEHELGELINHKLGIGMELLHAKKRGILKEYLLWLWRFDTGAFQERAGLINTKMPEFTEDIPKLAL